MNLKSLAKNIVVGFGGQFITIVLGLVIPRIFINSYGSDANGLLSTIVQIFTYLALLEAGIGQAAKNELYKPFKEKDRKSINVITSIAKEYYKKFTILYAIGVFALAIILPFVLKTEIDYSIVFWVVMLEGMAGVISFYFIEMPSIILFVDGKSYINNGIALANRVVGYLVKIVMAASGCSLIFLQLAYFVVTIAKVLVYKIYFRKKYAWIKNDKAQKGRKLKDRNAYVVTEFAATVFNSTDMIVLSIFLSTQMSSVYSVYNMIYGNINLLLSSVYFSIVYILGNMYHTDINKYEKVHDTFTSVFLGTMTILMSVSYVLTIPFVSLYTSGITDVEYIFDELPLLFCLIQILSWSRFVAGNLTGIAGFAKRTSYVSLFEAFLNIALSVLFVSKFGIVGVLFATVIALPIKVIWCIYIADKKVMHRSFKKTISIISVNFLLFGATAFISKFVGVEIETFSQFIIWGVVLTLIIGIIGVLVNYLANKDCFDILKMYLVKKE